jgi:sensor histidine kinase regulating citrate/malate metabolism
VSVHLITGNFPPQRRYEQERQIHDAINLKCHDIRHQIAALGDAGYQEELKKIGQMVNIYDAAPHTQNAALDVALSGKMLACTNLGITMTCLADGRRIGFMEDSDIYALFGNILDNAIEATKTVTEEEKRIISLTIGTTGDLLLIDSQNYYAGEIRFVDGLPQTSKENKEYHGFGTRSIKTLTEKYGGDLKISAENGIFRLSIMLPIPT